jgi:hypothetical protein
MTKRGASDSQQNTEGDGQIVKELHWVHHATFWTQVGLGIIGITALFIYGCQLQVMRGTLAEMKRSGEQSTAQVWSAIDNFNWMARSMDLSEKQSETSIRTARDQFQKDERPYIWLAPKDSTNWNSFWTPVFNTSTPQGFNVPGPILGQIRWEWHVVNYGKTPAYNVRYSSYLKIGDAPFVPSHGKGDLHHAPPMPPTAGLWSATESIPKIPVDSFGKEITTKIHITYEDAGRVKYESDVCLRNRPTPDYCENGNHIK